MVEIIRALIMAGGKGSRLFYIEKPLIIFDGKYLIDIIYETLKEYFDEIYVSVSKYVPKTYRHCLRKGYNIIFTSGESYLLDLKYCLKILKFPTFVSSADIPLNKRIVNLLLEEFSKEREIDIVTLTYKNNPVGVSVFRRFGKRYKNVDSDLFDIDTIEDIMEYEKRGHRINISLNII